MPHYMHVNSRKNYHLLFTLIRFDKAAVLGDFGLGPSIILPSNTAIL